MNNWNIIIWLVEQVFSDLIGWRKLSKPVLPGWDTVDLFPALLYATDKRAGYKSRVNLYNKLYLLLKIYLLIVPAVKWELCIPNSAMLTKNLWHGKPNSGSWWKTKNLICGMEWKIFVAHGSLPSPTLQSRAARPSQICIEKVWIVLLRMHLLSDLYWEGLALPWIALLRMHLLSSD